MNCKCGKDTIRVTLRGKSYCWACYDQHLKAAQLGMNETELKRLIDITDLPIYKSPGIKIRY